MRGKFLIPVYSSCSKLFQAVFSAATTLNLKTTSLICDSNVIINMILPYSIIIILSLLLSVQGLGVEVEDVTGKQLEAALQTEELLAVMFCE